MSLIVSDAVGDVKIDPTKDGQNPQTRNSMVDIWDSEDIPKTGSPGPQADTSEEGRLKEAGSEVSATSMKEALNESISIAIVSESILINNFNLIIMSNFVS